MLLETVALVPYQDSESSTTWYTAWHCHTCGLEQKRPVGNVPKTCGSYRFDQPMSKGTRVIVCQRTVGEDPLPGYGPVILSNRPVRIRMPGGVGAGGENPPATRLVYEAPIDLTCMSIKAINSSSDFSSDSISAMRRTWNLPVFVRPFR